MNHTAGDLMHEYIDSCRVNAAAQVAGRDSQFNRRRSLADPAQGRMCRRESGIFSDQSRPATPLVAKYQDTSEEHHR